MASRLRKPETRARVKRRTQSSIYLRFPDKAALVRLEKWAAAHKLGTTEAARRLIDSALAAQRSIESMDAYGLWK